MRLTPRWPRGQPQRARLRAASCSGFTYLGVMFIVGVLALTASAAGVVWSTAQRRDNERELVFVGRQFQAAIERYRQSTTGAQTPYPRTLQELLRDDRAIVPQRHLRRLFVDPITGNAQWGLIQLPGGGIVGVHSLSDRVPFPRKTVLAGFDVPPAATYQGWRFIAPSAAALLAPPAASAASAPAPADSALGLPTSATSVIPATPAAPAQSPRTDAQAEPNPSGAADTPRLPRPRQDDFRNRTADACSRIAAYEEQVCRDQTSRFGEAAGRACQDSALARNLACLGGDSAVLPTLELRAD